MAMDVNPVWVTQTGPVDRHHSDPVGIEAAWADGQEFRVYRYATMVSVNDTERLMRAGFTHLRCVYQKDDLSVHMCDVSLRKHLRAQQ